MGKSTKSILSLAFPIKFCLKSLPPGEDNDYLIVRFYSLKNGWYYVGDSKSGLHDWNAVHDYPVAIEGKNPQEIVSVDLYLWDNATHFILYGEYIFHENPTEHYTIICTDWDILGELDIRNSFRPPRISNNYLTIFDFKWFDDFRGFILGEYPY